MNFILSLQLGVLGLSYVAGSVAWAQNEKYECAQEALKKQDCLLLWQNYRVHFLKSKILIHDGTWRGIQEIPVAGEKSEWEKVQVHKLDGRWVLEMWVWSPPATEMALESLYWLVGEFKDQNLHFEVQEVVQYRRRLQAQGIGRFPASSTLSEQGSRSQEKHPSSQTDLLDPRRTVQLYVKDGKIHWQAGEQAGELGGTEKAK